MLHRFRFSGLIQWRRAAFATVLLPAITVPLLSQETKVAIVSLQSALLATQEGQKASADLNAKVEPKRKEFETRQAQIAQSENQLKNQGSVLSAQKREELARDLDGKKKKLQRDMQDAEEELENQQQAMLQGLGQKMMAVIEKYAKDNKYSLVLEVGNPNTPVVYSIPSADITKDVAALFDKTPHDGPTPTAPKPPGSPGR